MASSCEDPWTEKEVYSLLNDFSVPSWWNPSKYFIIYNLLNLLFDNCDKVNGKLVN